MQALAVPGPTSYSIPSVPRFSALSFFSHYINIDGTNQTFKYAIGPTVPEAHLMIWPLIDYPHTTAQLPSASGALVMSRVDRNPSPFAFPLRHLDFRRHWEGGNSINKTRPAHLSVTNKQPQVRYYNLSLPILPSFMIPQNAIPSTSQCDWPTGPGLATAILTARSQQCSSTTAPNDIEGNNA